jgi:hypothetical protein
MMSYFSSLTEYAKSFFPKTDLSFIYKLSYTSFSKGLIPNSCTSFCRSYSEFEMHLNMVLESISAARQLKGSTILEFDVKIQGTLYGEPIDLHFTDAENFILLAEKYHAKMPEQKAQELKERKADEGNKNFLSG